MDEIGDLIKETRIESLSQPGRPATRWPGTARSPTRSAPATPTAAAAAMHEHVVMVSDVALLRERP